MMTARLKSIVILIVTVFLLAGPLAFQDSCAMSNCCCHPPESANSDLAFGKAPCCGCNTMEKDTTPIQTAIYVQNANGENIKPELEMEFADQELLSEFNDISFRPIDIKSLPPPLLESRVNSPLIC